MKMVETGFEGLWVIEPSVFHDSRGFFFEGYNKSRFEAHGLKYDWIQDNQSHSNYGVIRGLHFQKAPYAQAKMIRVLQGAILDVVVDLRKDQPTYGRTYAVELSASNFLQLLIPKGFAHGFSVLSPSADVLYKCDAVYHKESESGLRYDDATLAIDWKIPTESRVVSDKDIVLPAFSNADYGF